MVNVDHFIDALGRFVFLHGNLPAGTTASSLLLLSIVILVDRPLHLPFSRLFVLSAIVGIALLSAVMAYINFFQILSTAGPVNLMLGTFLVPVSALLPRSIFLGESIEPTHWTCMTFIGLGLLLVDGCLQSWIRSR